MRAADPAAKLAELLSRPLVKVCGLTREEDVAAAAEAGADLAGFILVPESPRAATGCSAGAGRDALGRRLGRRGGRVPAPTSTRCTPSRRARCAAARRRSSATASEVARVLDLPVGGHDPDHWRAAAEAEGRIVLAGKLGPDNVRAAIAAVRPWAVDAASSLESAPGIKDHDKVRRYVEAARS